MMQRPQFTLYHCFVATTAAAIFFAIVRLLPPVTGPVILGLMILAVAWCTLVTGVVVVRFTYLAILRFWDWHAKKYGPRFPDD